MTQPNPRLWELSEEIQELERAIAAILEDDSLRDEQKETKLEQAFDQWLQTGESFKVKAEQVAAYIRHQEALAEARNKDLSPEFDAFYARAKLTGRGFQRLVTSSHSPLTCTLRRRQNSSFG